jgi:uncharacterized protein (TIGR02145 family)
VTTGSPTGFSITSGNTNDAFAISSTGQITVAKSGQLDYETTTSYTVTVEITKADTTSQSATITINVTNVIDGAAMTISDQSRSIAENSANGASVGEVLVTTGSPTGFSITSGNTNDAFAISSTGQITVADVGELDFETTTSYTLTVEITKADTTSQSATITINVTNVDEAVVMTAGGVTYPTVQIGTQIWTASNVSIVPTGFNEGADGNPGEYYTYYFGGGGTAADEDGYYYTWAAALNVCPAGWRLPSDQDWQDLEQELGMPENTLTRDGYYDSWSAYTGVGTQLLAGGTSGFNAKFAGQPQGKRGDYAYFWSSTDTYHRVLRHTDGSIRRAKHSWNSMSVRCLKNN